MPSNIGGGNDMKKRILSIALALLLTLSLGLTACSAATTSTTTAQTTSAASTAAATEETTTVTETSTAAQTTTTAVYDVNAPASWSNVAWSQEHSGVEFTLFDDVNGMYQSGIWGTEPVSRKITEMTGVLIRDVGPAYGDDAKSIENRELTVLLGSGELPDFVYTGTEIGRFENNAVSADALFKHKPRGILCDKR